MVIQTFEGIAQIYFQGKCKALFTHAKGMLRKCKGHAKNHLHRCACKWRYQIHTDGLKMIVVIGIRRAKSYVSVYKVYDKA